jgi:hypothetical protein
MIVLNSVIDSIHAELQRVGHEILNIQNQQNIGQIQRQYSNTRQTNQVFFKKWNYRMIRIPPVRSVGHPKRMTGSKGRYASLRPVRFH